MSMSQEEIEALMSGAESMEEDEPEEVSVEKEPDDTLIEDLPDDDLDSEVDIDSMLAGIDGIVDDGTDEKEIEDTPLPKKEEKNSDSIEEMIETSQYPLPVKNENKVVNQLNEVADDSEEKASQIFDVLSFILDQNNEVQKYNKNMGEFIDGQVTLLEALAKKFPNIDVFSQNLETAKSLVEDSKSLNSTIDGENNKVFEAMELMQYHDINRQKIERVMAVIRKLSSYLNGIFEDDNEKPEVQIAKHISGDANDVVAEDDINSLIAEFSNEG